MNVGACSGMILNNYAVADAGAAAARLLMGVAIVGAYPLLFEVLSDLIVVLHYGT